MYLPLRSVLTIGNFNISSNIAAQSSSTLRFIAEDAAFFISDKTGVRFADSPADLKNDYICVIELGLFELSLRLSEKSQMNPKIDLRASANVAHIWTCSDSAKALADLLMYFASDGDINFNESNREESVKVNATVKSDAEEQILIKTEDSENLHSLSKSQVALVNDLIEEAMKESKIAEGNNKKGSGGKEGSSRANRLKTTNEDEEGKVFSLGSESNDLSNSNYEDKDDSWEKEFYIVQNEAGMGMMVCINNFFFIDACFIFHIK